MYIGIATMRLKGILFKIVFVILKLQSNGADTAFQSARELTENL